MTPESLDKSLFDLLFGELESISQALPGDPLMPFLHPCFLCLSEPPRLTDQERPFPCRQMYRGSKLEQGTAGDSVMPGNRAVLVLSHRLHTWHHLYQPRALFFADPAPGALGWVLSPARISLLDMVPFVRTDGWALETCSG